MAEAMDHTSRLYSSCYDEHEQENFSGYDSTGDEVQPSPAPTRPLALVHEPKSAQAPEIQHGIPVLYHGPESFNICQQPAIPTGYLETHASYDLTPGSGTHSFPPYSDPQGHMLRSSDSRPLPPYIVDSHYGSRPPLPDTRSSLPFGRYSTTGSNVSHTSILNGTVYSASHPVMSGPQGSLYGAQLFNPNAIEHHGSRTSPPDMSELLDWECTKTIENVADSQRRPVTMEIQAKIDKGFFKAETHWTCYRRNYFAVNCCYNIKLQHGGGEVAMPCCLYGDGGSQNLISRFAICIAACVSNEDDKPVELIQHTPKRDKGPINTPKLTVLQPNPSGRLGPMPATPMSGIYSPTSTYYPPPEVSHYPSSVPASSSPPAAGGEEQTTTTFERIQFKKATANNGKRRAAQQYFRVRVELYAGTLKSSAIGVSQPGRDTDTSLYDWTKVAIHQSAEMVVRGRSPGHYTDSESRNQANRGGGPGPGGGHGRGGEGGSGAEGGSAGGGSGSMNPYDPSSQQGYGPYGSHKASRWMGNHYQGHIAGNAASVGHFSPVAPFAGLTDGNMPPGSIGPVHGGQVEHYQENPGLTGFNLGLLSPNSLASTPKPRLLRSPSHAKIEPPRRSDYKAGQHFIPRSDPNCTLPFMPSFETEAHGVSWGAGNGMTVRDMHQRWPQLPPDPLRIKHESHSPP